MIIERSDSKDRIYVDEVGPDMRIKRTGDSVYVTLDEAPLLIAELQHWLDVRQSSVSGPQGVECGVCQ